MGCREKLTLLLMLVATAATAAAAEEPPAPIWKYEAQLLRPIWRGDTVDGEPVLFVASEPSKSARASLLFPVEQLLAVRNSKGDVTYEEGRDYTWQRGSREVVLPKGSRIVPRASSDLRRPANSQKYQLTHRDGQGEILFGARLEYHEMQTCVTYTHAPDLWKGPAPTLAERELPHALARLRSKRPLQIVLLGDSISSGCNASGWAEGAPFQPPYQELLERHLAESYGAPVRLKNLSVGGTDTAWALTQVEKVVAEQPHLVILAFGMNDSAGRPPRDYEANVAKAMATIRERLPECEFILVAPMLGNRDWVRLRHDYFPGYRDALAGLVGRGVALADLTGVWTEFLAHKKDCDLTGNGVNHPNDFGHRVYASVLAALLVPEP